MTLSTSSRLKAFLAASFASTVGDTLLVFAVPIGLGLETGDLRSSVLMWLIPAIAVYFSSFLHSQVSKSAENARRNYAVLLIAVALLELIVAALVIDGRFNSYRTLLISIFIFGYAFIKEGVPRLLYVVSVYSYFVDAKDYAKAAGLNHGLNIAATLAGTLLASILISSGTWRWALAIDAATFLVLASALLMAGKDPKVNQSEANTDLPQSIPKLPIFNYILITVTALPIANSLVWNYLPLFGERYSIVSASQGLYLIALLRLPGMVAGFNLTGMIKKLGSTRLILGIPAANIIASLAFVIFPSLASYCLLIIVQGFVSGVYWPTDYTKRSELPHVRLVPFNKHALRRIAVFQALACVAAIIIFGHQNEAQWLIPAAIGFLMLVSFTSLTLMRASAE